jgi:hypothetical protein
MEGRADKMTWLLQNPHVCKLIYVEEINMSKNPSRNIIAQQVKATYEDCIHNVYFPPLCR